MLKPPKTPPRPKIERLPQMDWLKGYTSTLDDDRKDVNGLKTASNVVIEQNGTVRPRPSMVLYGTQPPGTVLGEVFPFIKMNGTTPENWEACVCVVSATANVYVNKDGGAWTLCSGKNYDTSARCHFEQISSKLLVTNGVDNLSYLDIPTLSVVPFTSLTTPTGLGLTADASLTTSPNYNYRVRISAANQGETAACAAQVVAVNTLRDNWTGSNKLTIVFNRVTNASRYLIYIGTDAGFEYFLDSIPDPGSGTTVTYIDTGTVALNTNRLAPNGDSTAGPKTTRSTNVLGQIHMDGDSDNPYRHWFGGTDDTSALDFSSFGGGGWVEIDKGGKNFPVISKPFRTGKGDPVATVLMKGQSGHGKLVHVAMSSTTVGDTIINFADISEANGQDGTDAPDAAIYANDSLWYPSRDGMKNTRTKPQIQNILSTDNFSTAIQPDVKNLNVKNMERAVGVEFEGRLYFAMPVGSETNNQIWVCDLARNEAWMLPWYVNADWLWVADDNTGFTRFKVLSDNQIYEFTYAQATKDDEDAFATTIASGINKFSKDGMEWGSMIDVTFVFLRPQGNITITIVGKTADEPIAPIASQSFSPTTSVAGWNELYFEDDSYINEVREIPTVFGTARETVKIEIDEELNWWTWEVSSQEAGVDFQLSEVIPQFVNIGVIDTD